jgi:ferric-dicitrate binding protein FerR (iron transport regulator)
MVRAGWRAAACLVLLAGAWMAWRFLGNKGPDEISVYNPSGKILQVSLPDSSHVWLNAASTLRYGKNFAGRRELYLEGEGYFDVAEDAVHPFVVHSGALTTTVLGTSFDVRNFATDSSATVTVIRGKVQVENTGKILDRLTPARQLQWNERTRQARTVSVDTTHILAWQHGQLQFAGEDLQEIAAALGRWYGMKFILKNETLRSCKMYASFDNTISIQQALTVMSNVIDIQWTIDEKDRVVTLSGKGCQ